MTNVGDRNLSRELLIEGGQLEKLQFQRETIEQLLNQDGVAARVKSSDDGADVFFY